MIESRLVALRWTIGDVSPAGFEALRFSILGMWNIFGPGAAYAVCVNHLPAEQACERVGPLPVSIHWIETGSSALPDFLRPHIDHGWAEGAAWKLAPLRVFPRRYELALDNDCIIWRLPAAIREWLEAPAPGCVFAEDVRRCLGGFDRWCGPGTRNSGIRGLPPDFNYAAWLRRMLSLEPIVLRSELDEQGLQAATLEHAGTLQLVRCDEVTICSPFQPHAPHLGSCGAHFVGLNARALPWSWSGRPASELTREHWERLRPELGARVGDPEFLTQCRPNRAGGSNREIS